MAISDPDQVALAQAAESAPRARTYTDPGEMLEVEDLDLVAVLAPASEHASLAALSLEAGLPTLVEKPLALTLEQVDQIGAAQRSSGALVGVGFVFRRHRLIEKASEMVTSGRIGNLKAIESAMTGRSLSDPKRSNQWRGDPERGGGVLNELASHHFDLWSLLAGGEVGDLSCSASPSISSATVSAIVGDGVVAAGTFSDEAGLNHALTLFGDEGTLSLRLDRHDGLRLTRATRLPGDPGERARAGAALVRSLPAMVVSHLKAGDLARAFEDQWRDFATSVRDESAFMAGLEQGRAVLAATVKAADSARRAGGGS